uniref:Uncharacterized protein n=1 Tax=Panagrellus redivivus TaxID=6233 RepID=A0A7E4V8S4_PANRE
MSNVNDFCELTMSEIENGFNTDLSQPDSLFDLPNELNSDANLNLEKFEPFADFESENEGSLSPAIKRKRGRPLQENVQLLTGYVRKYRSNRKVLDELTVKYGDKILGRIIRESNTIPRNFEIVVDEFCRRNNLINRLEEISLTSFVRNARGAKPKDGTTPKSRERYEKQLQRKSGIKFDFLVYCCKKMSPNKQESCLSAIESKELVQSICKALKRA